MTLSNENNRESSYQDLARRTSPESESADRDRR